MATAILSDLHLGTTSRADLARRAAPLELLLEVLADADRVVFLGDLLELRERPATAVLEDVAPVLRQIGEATADKQVVIVPGNHDHQLVGPALERARLRNGRSLPLDGRYACAPGELGEHVASLMPGADIEIAYPGVWLRDDVYAMHGHYLDVHLTVPRLECLIAAAVERYASEVGKAGPASAAHYEAILSPIYALAHAVAQNARARPATSGTNFSRRIWSSATTHGGGGKVSRTLIGRLAIPALVTTVNMAGLGPFRADISPDELRRAGLQAIADVVDRLDVGADHVIFGHTHRAGPLDHDADGWRLPNGTTLTNTGSWIYEDVFIDRSGPANPYWPGRVALLGDKGPPELESVLDSLDLAALRL